MRVSIAGRHLEMTDALKGHVESRLEKVRHHFDKVIDVDVVLSVEKHRHIADVTLHANGIRIHSRESSGDMYSSVDTVVEKIDRQIHKFKERSSRFQPRKSKVAVFAHEAMELEPDERHGVDGAETVAGHAILREPLTLKPMDVEEAAMQLNLSNDSFIVFRNSETQSINVLYAKHDGAYALIEPEA